jgi:hypothetical protein
VVPAPYQLEVNFAVVHQNNENVQCTIPPAGMA